MIDHIMCQQSSAEAPGRSQPCWTDERGRTVMPVTALLSEAEFDDAGNPTRPAVYAPGVWLIIRAETPQADLIEDPCCVLVADSLRAQQGQSFVLANRLAGDTMLAHLTPVFAGDAYPFGQAPVRIKPEWMIG